MNHRTIKYLPLVSFLITIILSGFVHAQSTQQLTLGSANQSSTGFSGVASRALDGNTNGRYNKRSVTHTANGDSQAWWEASLESSSNVTEIELFNRTDGCCSSRLTDFYVFLSNSPFSSDDFSQTLNDSNVWSYYHAGAVGDSLTIPVHATGQYVRIQKTGGNALSLAEVVVNGNAQVIAEPEPIVTVEPEPVVESVIETVSEIGALTLSAANQSSTGFSGVASRALDGNTNGRWNKRSVTHTARNDSQAWWEASLASVSFVTQIDLWNRTDRCCSSRLSDFYVFLSDTPFSSNDVNNTLNDSSVWSYYHAGAVGDSLTVPVNATGRYVRIQQTGSDPLSLAEVAVTGGAISVTEAVPAVEPEPVVAEVEPVVEPEPEQVVETEAPEVAAAVESDGVETPPSVFAAIDDTGTVVNGTAVIDILANDLGNINPSTVATYIPESTSKGYVHINPQTGVITYTPYAGSTGRDTYGYTVQNADQTISNVAIVTIALDASIPCEVPESKNETVSLLLVGNSLMNDIQARLKDLLDCGGYGSEMATSNPGGNFLHQHDVNPTTTNLIAQGYDLTLLQEQSFSINTNVAPYPVINSLKSKIETAGSVMGFYQTWGYQHRDPVQTEEILSGYDRVAGDFDAPLIHIGRAWDYFYTSHNENPPFSLYLDYAHPTEEGKALIAYVLYAYLTGESPIGLYSFLLSEDSALLLQTTAWDSYLANR